MLSQPQVQGKLRKWKKVLLVSRMILLVAWLRVWETMMARILYSSILINDTEATQYYAHLYSVDIKLWWSEFETKYEVLVAKQPKLFWQAQQAPRYFTLENQVQSSQPLNQTVNPQKMAMGMRIGP